MTDTVKVCLFILLSTALSVAPAASAPAASAPADGAPAASALAADERPAAATAAPDLAAARQIVQQLTDSFPGLSVAVAAGGELVWQEGFGYADLARGVPATPETRYLVLSAAKAWTATAAGVLLEGGRLDPERPIRQLVPGFPDKGAPITTMQLATHTAGIRHYRDDAEALDPGHCETVGEALALFQDDPLEYPPGQGRGYSSWGYVLLGAVIESAAGQPFDRFLHGAVLEPAGMLSTVHAEPEAEIADLALPYRRVERDGGAAFEPVEELDVSCKWGAGGYAATAGDLARFYLALLDGRLVGRETAGLILRPDAEGLVRFGGASTGGRSQLLVDTKRGIVVAIAANARGEEVDLHRAATAIAAAFGGGGTG